MGTSADRFTGYFFTRASNRSESCGEKTDIVSGLIASTPEPRLQRPYPSLLRLHPHPDPHLGPIAMFRLPSIEELRSVHSRATNSLGPRYAANPTIFLRVAP